MSQRSFLNGGAPPLVPKEQRDPQDPNEDIFIGSAPPPTFANVTATVPQPSSYENFASYTLMGDQPRTDIAPPLLRTRSADSNPNLEQSGPALAGVGIYFKHDPYYGAYVANVVPNSAAHHCGLIMRGDCLTSVDTTSITAQSSLEQVRGLLVGIPGTLVNLSFRRPGATGGTGKKSFFYYDVRLFRGSLESFMGNRMPQNLPLNGVPPPPPPPEEQPLLQPAIERERSSSKMMERAGPPPPPDDGRDILIAELRSRIQSLEAMTVQIRGAEGERTKLKAAIETIHEKLDGLEAEKERFRAESQSYAENLAPVDEELKMKMEELRRLEQVLFLSQEKTKEFEKIRKEKSTELAGVQKVNKEMEERNKALRLDLENLERDISKAQEDIHQGNDILVRVNTERERIASAFMLDKGSASKVIELLDRAGRGHAEIMEALKTQESQMVRLADVIPALDMAHSALLSCAVPHKLAMDALTEKTIAPELFTDPRFFNSFATSVAPAESALFASRVASSPVRSISAAPRAVERQVAISSIAPSQGFSTSSIMRGPNIVSRSIPATSDAPTFVQSSTRQIYSSLSSLPMREGGVNERATMYSSNISNPGQMYSSFKSSIISDSIISKRALTVPSQSASEQSA